MTLIVESHVAHPDLFLSRTIRAVPHATISIEHSPITDRERPLLFVRVKTDDPAAFERALSRDPTVRDPLFVTRIQDDRLYRVEVTDVPHLLSPKVAEQSGRIIETRSTEDGWFVRAEVPDRDSIRRFRRYCEEHGIQFSVQKLYRAEHHDRAGLGLTDEQREMLLTAYASGYFDVPRCTNQAELAAEFDVTDSAVSQRLRRAVAALIEAVLDPDSVN